MDLSPARDTPQYKQAFYIFRSFRRGQGVPRDQVLAYMWLNIASSNGNKNAIQFRNLLEKKMSPQQIAEAQRLARNWKPKK